MISLETAAHVHLDLGHSLLPVGTNKRPHSRALLETGYRRVTPEGVTKPSWAPLQRARPDLAVVLEWLKFPACGLGLVTGDLSGLVIIDGDGESGIEKFDRWGITPRAHVRTISGGLHYYVRHPGWKVRTVQTHTGEALDLIRGVDIRGDGGYAVIPPTAFTHGRYQSLRHPRNTDPLDHLPWNVREVMHLHAPPQTQTEQPQAARAAPAPGPAAGSSGTFEPLPPGERWVAKDGTPLERELVIRALEGAWQGQSREGQGFWLAQQLRDNGFAYGEAWAVLQDYQAQVPDVSAKGVRDPYTLTQARISLDQVYSRTPRQPWGQRPRTPDPASVAQQLRDLWPRMTAPEREQAARYACGIRGERREEALTFLAGCGVDVSLLREEAQRRQLAGEAVPGTASLVRLLLDVRRRLGLSPQLS